MHAACATHQSRVLHEVIPAEISALNYEGLYGEEKFGTKLCLIWSTNWEAGDNFEIMTDLYGEEEYALVLSTSKVVFDHERRILAKKGDGRQTSSEVMPAGRVGLVLGWDHSFL